MDGQGSDWSMGQRVCGIHFLRTGAIFFLSLDIDKNECHLGPTSITRTFNRLLTGFRNAVGVNVTRTLESFRSNWGRGFCPAVRLFFCVQTIFQIFLDINIDIQENPSPAHNLNKMKNSHPNDLQEYWGANVAATFQKRTTVHNSMVSRFYCRQFPTTTLPNI